MAHANGCLLLSEALRMLRVSWVGKQITFVLVTSTVVVSLAFVACATQAKASV